MMVIAASALALTACGDSTASYSLSGAISGLSAGGLVLVNNGVTVTPSSGATSFVAATVFQTGQTYAVTVQTQPTGLVCSVANGAGTFTNADVSNITVTCVPTYTLGGTISGLAEDGLVLADNGETLSVDSSAGTFMFATRSTSSTEYAVTVATQPVGVTCSVANATGAIGTANVNNVVVTCSNQAYALGGSISGLNGSGLVLANGTDQLAISSGATTFTLPAPVAHGSSYTITVATQPQGVTCSVPSSTGTMGTEAVANIAVVCSDQPYTLGGTVSGLTVAGLVLANGADTVQVPLNAASFMLPAVAYSKSYSVTVATQPAGLTCSVSNGSGTMPAANFATVAVVCNHNAYALGGSISGLANSGLVLTDGTDTVNVASNATSFTLPTSVAFDSHYQVSIASQPANSMCSVSNGSGAMPASNVSNVTVTCAVTAYTLGGQITGGTLTASGLVLSDGTDRLMVAANAAVFSMPTGVAIGAHYSVAIAAQPAGLLCALTNDSGTMPSADVSNVQVNCTAREWTWINGSNMIGNEGSSGTMGVASSTNAPAERDSSMNWTDHNGRLWLFGGGDQYSGRGGLNDLWMFDPGTGLWTWMKGPVTSNGVGSYGTKGVAAPANVPPARDSGTTWVDSAGHLWLFGGASGSPGISGYYNDLWMYDIATNNWTWVGGPSTPNDPGSAGTRGVAAVGNLPSSREFGLGWTDSTGHFWLFGGNIPGTGNVGLTASDLWMYDPASGDWTWVNGAITTTADVATVYGVKGVASATNTPGARRGSATWADSSGHLWLFGGNVYDSVEQRGNFADLWVYDMTSDQWTWVGGANTLDTAGTNGALGVAAPSNTPGARGQMGFWTDHSGRFWMFGGSGEGGNASAGGGWLSDLWMFDPATREWTWVNGPSDPSNNGGVYGTQGVSAPGNVPGGRVFPLGWVDGNGSFWLFGGYGADSNGYHFDLNDLWRF
jgi:hypothetical protein